MCVTISVRQNGEYTDCGSVGELADRLGVAPEVVSDSGRTFCLCNAHLTAIGAVRNTADWWPEYIIDLDTSPARQEVESLSDITPEAG